MTCIVTIFFILHVPMILKSQRFGITLSHNFFSLLVMIFAKMAQLNHKPMTTPMKGIIANERISHPFNIKT